MQISLGVRFIKAFISKNYDLSTHTSLQVLQKDLDLSFIPILERRRLSDSSKIAFGLLKTVESMPIIFSSQKGEINRCFDMLKDLAIYKITSPTAFSLSVLNSTPALLAIASKNHSEILALSARDSLECALLNAYLMLCDGSKSCLVISYDEAIESKEISAIAMCVSLDSTMPQISLKKENAVETIEIPSNIAFLKAFSQNSSHYQNGDFALDLSSLLQGFTLADF